mmetsp:Transcript_6004/g.10398  ORF Transcript_6004/g.10398 Transcript_6004/m.10398 type:complete len:354 (-) Transcript_6004:2599-3660(-)
MLADLLAGDGPDGHTGLVRLELLVIVLDQLQHVRRHLLNEHQRLPVRVRLLAPHLVHLVPQLVAARLPPQHRLDGPARLHGLLVFGREVHARHLAHLLVATHVEAVLDVLEGRVLQRGFQMMHGMLRNVRHAQVVVLPHLTGTIIRFQLAHHELHHGGLTGTVLAHQGNPRAKAQRPSGVRQDRLVGGVVLEGHVRDAHHRLALADDPVQPSRVREDDGLVHLVDVGHRRARVLGLVLILALRRRGAISRRFFGCRCFLLGSLALPPAAHRLQDRVLGGRQRRDDLWPQPLEFSEAAVVICQLAVRDVHDVGQHLRQEVVVVRHHKHGGGQSTQLVLQPLHGGLIQMVSGLVQ